MKKLLLTLCTLSACVVAQPEIEITRTQILTYFINKSDNAVIVRKVVGSYGDGNDVVVLPGETAHLSWRLKEYLFDPLLGKDAIMIMGSDYSRFIGNYRLPGKADVLSVAIDNNDSVTFFVPRDHGFVPPYILDEIDKLHNEVEIHIPSMLLEEAKSDMHAMAQLQKNLIDMCKKLKDTGFTKIETDWIKETEIELIALYKNAGFEQHPEIKKSIPCWVKFFKNL